MSEIFIYCCCCCFFLSAILCWGLPNDDQSILKWWKFFLYSVDGSPRALKETKLVVSYFTPDSNNLVKQEFLKFQLEAIHWTKFDSLWIYTQNNLIVIDFNPVSLNVDHEISFTDNMNLFAILNVPTLHLFSFLHTS